MAESITLQTSDSNVQASDVLGRLSFAASNESSGSDARLIGASIYAIAESDFTAIANATSLIFATASSENAQEVMRITSSKYVGIGTSVPAAKLNILSAKDAAYGNLYIQDSTTMAAGVGGSIVFGGKYTSAGDYARYGLISAIKENSTSADSKSSMVFYTNDQTGAFLEERVRISSDGSVGIGTASPSQFNTSFNQLVVGGGSAYQGATIYSTTQGTLAFGDTATNGIDGYRGYLAYIHNTDYMLIGTAGAERVRITAGGNVGIGTIGTIPTSKLQVEGGNVTFNDNGGNYDFRVEGDTDPNLLFVDASVDDVGIGTATPAAKLHVAGDSLFENLSYRRFTTSTAIATHFRKYTDIIHYANSASTVAGSLRIEIPVTTSTMWSMDVVIVEYDNAATPIKTTTVTITGYATTNANPSVLTNNPSRISQVRFGRNTANNRTVILIDPVSTFRYPKAYIKEINTHHTSETTFQNSANYALTITTDETNFTLNTTITNAQFIRDDKLVNTFANQTITGNKTFNGNIVINENGENFDFRVEGDTDANLLFTDASTDRIGIGLVSPAGKLHVYESSSNQSYKYTSYVSANHYTTSNATNYVFGNYTDIRKHVSTGITDTGYVMGHDIIAVLSNEGVLSGSYGLRTYAGINNQSSNGNVTAAYGIQSRVLNFSQGTGNINTARGVDVYINGDLGSVGNGGITNAYGVYINSIVNATNKYGIYQVGASDQNYFAGDVGIGTGVPVARLNVEGGNVTFNDLGGNFDFRVEGDTDANLLCTDASTDRVGVGTISPLAKLHVNSSTATPFLVGDTTQAEPFFFTRGGSAFISAGFGRSGAQANCRIQYYSNPVATGNYWIQDADIDSFSLIRVVGNVADSPIFKLENGAATFNNAFTLPSSDGSSGQALVTNGSGVVSWSDVSSGSSNLTRGSFDLTQTSGTFNVSGGYNVGTLDVYYNGIKLLGGTDYTATNGTSFTLTNVATSGDVVEYVALNASTSAVGNTSLGSVTVTSSQSVFNVTNGYTAGGLAVFLNGVKLIDGTDFTATNGTSFTLTSAAASGDIVDYIAYGAVVASSNLQKTGDTMTGNLTVNADVLIGSGNSLTIGQGGSDSFTLPDADGSANQIIETDGGGNLSWVNKPQVVTNVYTSKTTYSVAAGGSTGTYIAVLNTSITPTKSSSKIRVELNISFEATHHDNIFRLFRSVNGGTDTEVVRNDDGNYWSGWAIPGYDADNASTPRTNHHIYIDSPNTTLPVTYKFMIQSAGAPASTFCLNRPANSAGTASYENAISQVILTEIPQ